MVLYVDASHFDQQKMIIAIKEITEGLGTVEHTEWQYACVRCLEFLQLSKNVAFTTERLVNVNFKLVPPFCH